MSIAAMAVVSLAREGVVRILFWYRARHGLERGDPAMPFPSWELQVS